MGLLSSIGEYFELVDNTLFGYGDTVTEGLVGDAVRGVRDSIVENPGKTVAVAVATVASGGLALAYAPAIGAMASAAGLGVAGGTLSGAAASSAGLAALGGGSLASGGLGMAGGTALVTGVGASLGAGISSVAVNELEDKARSVG